MDLYLLLGTVFLVHRLGTKRNIDKLLSFLAPLQHLTMAAGRLILRERENSGEPNLMRENTRGERTDSECACSLISNKLAGNVAPAQTKIMTMDGFQVDIIFNSLKELQEGKPV